MANKIQLNEAQLKQIIAESVKKVLNEEERYEPGCILHQAEDALNALKVSAAAYHNLAREVNPNSDDYKRLGWGLNYLRDLLVKKFEG
jgi:flagellar biosynthesis/type III secretory pathway protein FliH